MKEVYNDYMNKYLDLNKYEKREEIINKLRDLINVLGNYTEVNEDLISRELIDLKDKVVDEDDYLEGLFSYLNILEDMIANTLLKNE